ncbi:MAG: hypothetical protein AABX47_04815 [Nanoarchaeota archaeon]
MMVLSIALASCAPMQNIGGPDQGLQPTDSQQEALPADRQQMMAERMKPMIDACKGKAEGDACTVTSQRGERQGTCGTQKDQFLCVMQRPQGMQGPPQGVPR